MHVQAIRRGDQPAGVVQLCRTGDMKHTAGLDAAIAVVQLVGGIQRNLSCGHTTALVKQVGGVDRQRFGGEDALAVVGIQGVAVV